MSDVSKENKNKAQILRVWCETSEEKFPEHMQKYK